MTRVECKNEINSFKIAVENYKRVVLNNENYLPPDTHFKVVSVHRSQLNQKYGKLEKYIEKIGGGIGMTYLTAFSEEATHSVVNALGEVIQNLDRIIGRLEGMSEKEFDETFRVRAKIVSGDSTDLSVRLNILEFVIAISFAVCFTFIFATTRVLNVTFNWSVLWPYLVLFFSLATSIIYVILPIMEISRKVGLNVRNIYDEFILEFKSKTSLGKTKIVLVVIIGIYTFYQIIQSLASFVISLIR